MELIISPTSKKQIRKYVKEGLTTFLFGLKDYAVHQNLYLSLAEISKLKQQYPHLNLFISINKMLFNSDIEKLPDILKALSTLNIKGLFFYDLSIIMLKKKLNLPFELVWNQTHMVTNYLTCNYYYEQGVHYALLANEITLEEILKVQAKSSINLIIMGFGFPVVAHTKRKLLTNYFKYHKKSQRKSLYHLNCGDVNYLIKEEKTGSTIYKDTLLNITSVLDTLNNHGIPYIIIDGFNIKKRPFEKIVFSFHHYLQHKITINQVNQLINKVYPNNDNFFFKKTIYKVMKNEN